MSASKTEQAERFIGVPRHSVTICVRYTPASFLPSGMCGERRVWEDGREPRPNLVFQLGDQTEKVVYDDWNGVAAYKDQFNKNFREKVSK